MPGAEIDNGRGGATAGASSWRFAPNTDLLDASSHSIRGVLAQIRSNLKPQSSKPAIALGHGDPSVFPCFRPSPEAEDAVAEALRSGYNNSYAPTDGIAPAKRSIAEYLSRDLPYKLTADDVHLTVGCAQAIEVAFSVLARPGANVLLPRPGYPFYEARAAVSRLEVRHYDLLPDRGWEVDLRSVDSLADENTVAIVILNPGNPCGNVFTYQHLSEIAGTARKLGMMVIADEVYGYLTFGRNEFVPMGVFGSVVPVLTLGSISKRWVVPGWRLGWLVTCDPYGVLKQTKILDCIKAFLNIVPDPATFMQAAIPRILEDTKQSFHENTIQLLKQTSETCYEKTKEIECLSCPHKPEGSMFVMVKLDLSRLEDIEDDVDFCCKLAKEESLIILPGSALGLKNWLRVTFAVAPLCLEDALNRLKVFCVRHKKW